MFPYLAISLKTHCEFGPRRPEHQLHCNGCNTHHKLSEFSASAQEKGKSQRRCLGRQGTVQLCEHVHISWDMIKGHIAGWRPRKPAGWDACLKGLVSLPSAMMQAMIGAVPARSPQPGHGPVSGGVEFTLVTTWLLSS